MSEVGIVGGGSIGVAFAVTAAVAGVRATMFEPDPARRGQIPREVADRLTLLDDHGLLGPDALTGGPSVTADLRDAVEGADLVQECTPEDLELKRHVFADLLEVTDPATPVASSSSTITASQVVADMGGRERCLVGHPGNPPYLLPVVEVVPAPFTAPEAVERAVAAYRAIGMAPVVLGREIEGFAFNRLQSALLREAYCLVRDGVLGVDDVDRLVRDGLGRRWSFMGPFETADLNTRGGIERHAALLGPAYQRFGAERGQHDEWTPDLVAEVTRQRRDLLPLAEWPQRVLWRDEQLMRLAALKQQTPTAQPSTPE